MFQIDELAPKAQKKFKQTVAGAMQDFAMVTRFTAFMDQKRPLKEHRLAAEALGAVIVLGETQAAFTNTQTVSGNHGGGDDMKNIVNTATQLAADFNFKGTINESHLELGSEEMQNWLQEQYNALKKNKNYKPSAKTNSWTGLMLSTVPEGYKKQIRLTW